MKAYIVLGLSILDEEMGSVVTPHSPLVLFFNFSTGLGQVPKPR